ncbi:MAG: ATP-binding protein [Flavobacterium sp.]
MEKNNFFGFFQFIKQTYNNYTRQPFDVNENWFQILFEKHYTTDIQSKYNSSLFIDQDRGKALSVLNEIKFNSKHISPYKNELRILNEWLDKFPNEYKELKDFLAGENIEINTESKQHKQLELLLQKIDSIKGLVNQQNKILDIGINNDITLLPIIEFVDYEHGYGFNSKKIHDYEDEFKFINKAPSEEYPVAIVFRRQSEILNQIRNLNSFKIDFFNTVKIIHGKAGMGKSNISAYLTNTLRNEKHPVIIIKAKSFSGNPDEFNRILMEQLLVPNNYSIEEVLERINNYGKKAKKRIVLIFDGLNETTFANEGFSQIWQKNFDAFVELLAGYTFIYFITTLRTSYISRIWSNNQIPYSNFELKGFDESDLGIVVVKYFDHYNIGYNNIKKEEIFYFKTPLLIDLYCQMLNPKKIVEIQAVFGLSGFKDVFERYISKLSEDVKIKLTLGTVDQINDGIDRCSNEMLGNLEANIPLMKFYSLMQDENVVNVGGTIGDEILSEYLIYLDENHKGRDVIIHTQQEVGGYLLARKLIRDYGTVDNVVNSDIFTNTIIGSSNQVHQLKDDILKFLLIEADENSNIFTSYIDNPIVKKFSIITLQTETLNTKTQGVQKILDGNLTSKVDISELISGLPSYLFEPQSPLNFNFIKSQLLKLDANTFEYTWTKLIYDEYIKIDSLVQRILDNEVILEELENRDLIIDFLIWALETTIRELRDQITIILLDYFTKYPQLIFDKVLEYSQVNKAYIYERLASICYGVCLIEQNNEEFLNKILKDNILSIYKLQFGVNPTHPKFNYIVIDSIKHIVDLGIYKGIFQLPENDIDDFKNYKFNIEDWLNIDEVDLEIVRSIYLHWTLSDNPDPLRGDFVHYTIPRLEERDGDNRLKNTANIFKHILNLGYIQSESELSKTELKFKTGESLYGIKDKIDRLGKKYSWMAFFDYAGYLLNEGRLDVWRDDDSEFEKHYSRLGDVEIEITNPKQKIFSEKLYFDDLFLHKVNHQDWVYKTMYHTVNELFKKDDFTMLSGFINQRESESYDSRSFLLINSFFIKKDSVFGNIEDILNREFDWKDDIITSRSSLSKIYFGELYWADNIPTTILNRNDLPLESHEETERMITPFDIINYPKKYTREDLNKFIKISKKKRISFEVEPTLIDYSWESDSKIISTINSTIPSTSIGKQLKLRADTINLQILDKENILAHKSFDFKEDHYEQNFEYFRTDLLAEYMEQNGYLLVYQIKQHTYDRNSGNRSGDFRGMQFFLAR